jgi:hypothetical protein
VANITNLRGIEIWNNSTLQPNFYIAGGTLNVTNFIAFRVTVLLSRSLAAVSSLAKPNRSVVVAT